MRLVVSGTPCKGLVVLGLGSGRGGWHVIQVGFHRYQESTLLTASGEASGLTPEENAGGAPPLEVRGQQMAVGP